MTRPPVVRDPSPTPLLSPHFSPIDRPVSLFQPLSVANSGSEFSGINRKTPESTRGSEVWSRPTIAHRLLLALAVIQILIALVATAGTLAAGLTVEWAGALPVAAVVACLAGTWAYFTVSRPSALERRIADGCLAVAVLLVLTMTVPPSQYAALALNRPLVDPWLSSADAALGVSVKASAAWLHDHPAINRVLTQAYFSLLFQLALIAPLLAAMGRRDRLHEYLFHFHVCTLITVACLALWPAAGVFQYEQFTATLPEGRFIEHFQMARAGTLPTLVIGQMEGMVSFPSFHLAGAWMITWALRGTWLFWPVAALNVLLTLGTFATGAHYVVDGFGTAAMVLVSLALWRSLGLRG